MQSKSLLTLFSCSVLGLAFAACSKTEMPTASGPTAVGPTAANSPAASPAVSTAASQGSISSTDVVQASVAPLEVSAGGEAMVPVKVQIKEGYHINANPPTFAYLKATEVSAEVGEGLSAGKPLYPASVMRSFTFAEKPLAVYEGETEIKLPLKAAGSAAKGTRTLPLKLRVQACDDKACYPPGTINLPVGLTIK